VFTHHLLAALRSFRRNRSHPILSLTGLTVGMTVFLLIALWVEFQWSFDKFHANGDRIYRIILGYTKTTGIDEAVAPLPLGPALKDDYSEFSAYTRFLSVMLPLQHNGEVYRERSSLVDPDFLTMFSFPLLAGDGNENLLDPGSIVLSESLAHRIFGDQSPLGQVIEYDEANSFLVTGVVEDAPANSHLQFDCLLPISVGEQWGLTFDNWDDVSYKTYVMVRPGVPEAEANRRLVECLAKRAPEEEDSYYLQGLKKIYLYSNYKFDYAGLGSITHVRVIGGAGVLILLLACLNHMGLSTVKFTRRASEVGIRKVIGAGRANLVACFLIESALISGVALAVSIGLVEVLLPSMNAIAGVQIHLSQLAQPPLVLAIVSVFILTGVLAALYPAYWFSRLRPIAVVGGKYTHGPKGSALRRILVGVQFAIAIVLITSTVVVYRQLAFVSDKDLGFDREWLLSIRLSGAAGSQWQVLKDRLARQPGVRAVTALSSLPTYVGAGTSGVDWEGRPENQRIQMQFINVDGDFVETFGMRMTEGRFFSPHQYTTDTATGVVVNEAAVRAMGLVSPVGKRFTFDTDGSIIGVIEDFHYTSLHSPIEPLFLMVKPIDWHVGYRHLCVRLAPEQVPQTMAGIEQVWRELLPDTPFAYSFLDDQIDRLYQSEMVVRRLLSVFTGLALLIASLGLFSLVALSIQRRTKEIGVRKVLGASIPSVIYTVGREYAVLVIAANAVAWPVAYYAMSRWLESFVYRVELSAGTFLLAGMLALITAGGTVGWQALKAARANPVEALKYE